MIFTCPVCGYPELQELPRSPRTGGGSNEICPSCGFQFGVRDDDRGIGYDEWRSAWIAKRMPWDSAGIQALPPGWDPVIQLRRIGIEIDPS